MKTEKRDEKNIAVVYRNDGKTPDLRYKSSREYVSSQHREGHSGKKEDIKTPDSRQKNLRYHVLSLPLGRSTKPPVQIAPSGKKPVWKTGS